MSDASTPDRRHFLGTVAMTVAALELLMIDSAHGQSDTPNATGATSTTETNTAFAPLRQVDAGVLSVGNAEAGPADGPPVVLLHGWPYDIHSFVDVAPLLASKGYRVLLPYLRGYGTTRFLSTGGRGLPTSLRPCGRSAAKEWSR